MSSTQQQMFQKLNWVAPVQTFDLYVLHLTFVTVPDILCNMQNLQYYFLYIMQDVRHTRE